MSVNVENMRKWIEALRSGDYQQTNGVLRDSNGFCCLGVACDISGTGEWIRRAKGSVLIFIAEGDTAATTILPRRVSDWLGLDSEVGDVPLVNVDGPSSAIFDNDRGRTFEQIADSIESTYLTEDTF